MVDFTDHGVVIDLLTEAQNVDEDNRMLALEDNDFIDNPAGQWEDYVVQNLDSPRYTFDLACAIVDQVAGKIEKSNFAIKIEPAGGGAAEDQAELRGGIIRNLENLSGARDIYSTAGRAMATGGIAGWEVVQEYADGDSFNQDLLVSPIVDFENRVWFDPNAKLQTKSDADYSFKVIPITKDIADERYPDRTIESVPTGNWNWDWRDGFRPDSVFICQIYYKVQRERTLVLMSNDRVYEDNDDFAKIKDELAAKGITEKGRRPSTYDVIFSRLFDNRGFLEEADETVFRHWTPLIPVYGNYKISNNKMKYRGVVRKLKDPNRVFNYAMSRQVAEGALAPRAKYWMTPEQAEGHDDTLGTMNTNHDPFQLYNYDPNVPGPPQQNGGAQINPGLQLISEAMPPLVRHISGVFAANMGDDAGFEQSGRAVNALQEQGETGQEGYMKSLELGIGHTGCIMNDSLERVYDAEARPVITRAEDGTTEIVTLNEVTVDDETGEEVVLNDLSAGNYSVTCEAGPSYSTRQKETAAGVISLGAIMPEAMAMSGDIAIRNMGFPGNDLVADRWRARLFDAGQIPIDQMTDDELESMRKAMQAEAQQQQQPDPAMLIGQAELITAQNEQAKTQVDVAVKSAKLKLDERRQMMEFIAKRQSAANDALKTQQSGIQIAQAGDDQRFNQMIAIMEQRNERAETAMNVLTAQVKALVDLQTAAQGPVLGPGTVPTVAEQYDNVNEAQELTESALAGIPRIGN